MKKPNFENDFYTEVYNYLVSLHGSKNVIHTEGTNTIQVNLSNLVYYLCLSYNENKIYFHGLNPLVSLKITYEEEKTFKSFRVFRFNEAKIYIDFKNSENKLISSIAG